MILTDGDGQDLYINTYEGYGGVYVRTKEDFQKEFPEEEIEKRFDDNSDDDVVLVNKNNLVVAIAATPKNLNFTSDLSTLLNEESLIDDIRQQLVFKAAERLNVDENEENLTGFDDEHLLWLNTAELDEIQDWWPQGEEEEEE